MHLNILPLVGSLLLHLSAADDIVWSPPTWPPDIKQPTYWGDVLNITRCYCEGLNDDSNSGHYYQFDYHSYYKEQDYTLAWTCDSDVTSTGWGNVGSKRVHFPVPDCWNAHDSWREEKRKGCMRSYNGDHFCYETGNAKDPYDYYYFNNQKRRLPTNGIMESPPHQCAGLCHDAVGGKAVASECNFCLHLP